MNMRSKILLVVLLLVSIAGTNRQQETIKLYSTLFNSSEVSGTDLFAEPGSLYLTKIKDELEAVDLSQLFSRVGTYRRDAGDPGIVPLFNMSERSKPYPLLDAIDLDYYEDIAFDKLTKSNDYVKTYKDAFDKFKQDYDNSANVAQKKVVLNNHPLIKTYLVTSRLTVRRDSITLDQTKQLQLKASLKAELKNLKLNNGLELSQSIQSYLSKLVDEAFRVKGYYYVVRLDNDYIDKIKHHVEMIRPQDMGADDFSRNLIDCINAKNSAINSQVVAVELLGTYNKSKITDTQLASDLTTKLAIPAQQAMNLAASISATFEKKVDRNVKTSFNHVFLIRYGTGKDVDELAFKAK